MTVRYTFMFPGKPSEITVFEGMTREAISLSHPMFDEADSKGFTVIECLNCLGEVSDRFVKTILPAPMNWVRP